MKFLQEVGGGSIKIAMRFYKESGAFLEAKPSASPMEPPHPFLPQTDCLLFLFHHSSEQK